MMMMRVLVLLSLTLALVPMVLGQGNKELKEWFEKLSDSAEACDQPLDHGEGDLIFEVAQECSDAKARWDYNYNSKKKTKNGLFDGPGKLSMPAKFEHETNPDHNQFKFGFRHNKCIHVYKQGVTNIYGTFEKDKLQGKVKITFFDSSYLLGWTRDSKLIGPLRHFDPKNKLINVTLDHGNTVISHISNGMFKISTKGQSKSYFTDDFSEIFSCRPERSDLLRNCYETRSLKAEVKGCELKLSEAATDPVANQDRNLFSWNMKTNEKHFFTKEDTYPDCSSEWKTTDTMASDLKKWFANLNQDDNDIFWREFSDDQPLSESKPNLHFTVPEYLDRSVVKYNHQANFTTMDRQNLGSFKWKGGRIEWNVDDQDDMNDPRFSGLLKFDLELTPKTIGSGYIIHRTSSEGFLLGTLARFKQGKPHGIVRRFGRAITNPKHLYGDKVFQGLSYVGRYDQGVPVGMAWRMVVGNGFIYGKPDELGQLSGDDIAYIYPNLQTALVGKFKNGIMEEGRAAKVIATRCVNGIMEVKFSEPEGRPFHNILATNTTFGDQPLVTDILDDRYIEVRESGVDHQVADEGAFAKEDIPAGEVITLYNGYIFDAEQIQIFNNETKKRFDIDNLPKEDPLHWMITKYHGSVPECSATITIPHDLGALFTYRATLGHKLNHSFKPNCEYGGVLDSPRFGLIRAFYTNKEVKKGEELFISYGYPVESGPPWYRELYNKTIAVEGQKGIDEKVLQQMVGKKEEEKESQN